MSDAKKSNQARQGPTPDQIKLNPIQAQRLSQIARVAAKEIEGRNLVQLSQELKWKIDPDHFLFRRVCGQVVRWDPITGMYQPVPFATVHVMDTDCDFLFYSPFSLPWLWCFPFFCHQEEMASVVADECGRFCVWVPRFDIDWVVRWRLERYCFPEVFLPPSIGDILKHYRLIQKDWPKPGPDPGPLDIRQSGISLDRLASITGRATAKKILSTRSAASFGGRKTAFDALLKQPAFHEPVPPPISPELHELLKQHQERGSVAISEFTLGNADREYRLDLNRFVGPFLRWECEWIFKKELVPILDIPDITFWVQQDVDADGNLETIYQDGYFHVGWESGPLSDITLHASPIARISTTCDIPQVSDCKQPTILFAGLMQANSSYIDVNGFGWRVNPPHTDGAIRPSVFPPAIVHDTPATAPFTGTVQLYGCNQYPKGQYYRLLYKYNNAAPIPFTGLNWYVDPWPGPGIPVHIVPDAQGWYPILATPDAWFPPNELLDWPTTSYPNGFYEVTMEIGDAAKTVIYTTPNAVPFLVDNSANYPHFVSLAWREKGSPAWNYFPDFVCPMVHRVKGTDIEFRVEYITSMPHLLKMVLSASGCGGGSTIQAVASPAWSDPPSPLDPYEHWHTSPMDNFVSRAAIFQLPGTALPGCYGFTIDAYSRAFNPAGGDPSDPQAHDWYIDASWLNWNQANLSVAVVDL